MPAKRASQKGTHPMAGKILIVDAIAVNRIVLKAKLASAFYAISQASTAVEALTLAKADTPDLILLRANLPDMEAESLVRQLHAAPGLKCIPIVVLLSETHRESRLPILQTGASDVLHPPISEQFLLARLRSLIRQKHARTDIAIQSSTAAALGFAERQDRFVHSGHLGLTGKTKGNRGSLIHLKSDLSHVCPHQITISASDTKNGIWGDHDAPDVILNVISPKNGDNGLQHLAELHAAPESRHSRIIILLNAQDPAVAATAFDMGAHDVIQGPVHISEICLRLTTQLQEKQNYDQMRDCLKTGLQAAVIDPLTGLYNRRYALPFLERQIEHARLSRESFAIMAADLDHFKHVNDTHGHDAGDLVLQHVAHGLRSGLGGMGMLARTGGEEFLIVLPGSTPSDARETAAQLCGVIGHNPVRLPDGSEVHVTISIGVVFADQTCANPQILLQQADKALFDAKAKGRNRVTVSTRSAA